MSGDYPTNGVFRLGWEARGGSFSLIRSAFSRMAKSAFRLMQDGTAGGKICLYVHEGEEMQK